MGIMVNFATFQQIYGRSDPRIILLFTSPFDQIFPHIAVQADEGCTKLVVYPSEQADSSSPHATDQLSSCSSDTSAFSTLFHDCMDNGTWLVVRKMGNVSFSDWRVVGVRLATVLPDASHHLRRQFRLFTFSSPGDNPAKWAPPITCQYVMTIAPTGAVVVRTVLSPIFKGHSFVEHSTMLLQGGPSGGGSLLHGKDGPYSSISLMRKSSAAHMSDKTPAMNPNYVDEVLVGLREELLEQQSNLLTQLGDEIEQAVEEAAATAGSIQATSDPSSFVSAQDTGDDSVAPQRDPEQERLLLAEEKETKLQGNYGWIYPRILDWVFEQCPEVETSEIPRINNSDLFEDTILWKTQKEDCFLGTWHGTEVLIKNVLTGYNAQRNQRMKDQFLAEAARHNRLRHPQILGLFGLSVDNSVMVLEKVIGTLDQTLMRSRHEATRWSVRRVLQLAQQILRGLCFLSSTTVHRDIACRTIVETQLESVFKIAQFGCATSIRTPSDGDDAKIPVRWSAPEALLGVLDPRSDIWSFGVLMWEVLHYGVETPYRDHEQAGNAILNGVLLEQPQSCSRKLFDQVVSRAMVVDVVDRPDASTLLGEVEQALVGGWSAWELDQIIPFVDDHESFEFHNEKKAIECKGKKK